MAATKNSTQNSRPLLGHKLLRFLIGAYIVAVAVGAIPGTGATPLAAIYLSPEPAALIGQSIFFILGYLVLTGLWLRPASMLLGVILFWSSYLLHLGPAAIGPMENFWRDLILVSVLFLTYARVAPRSHEDRTTHNIPSIRNLLSARNVTPRRVPLFKPAKAMQVPVTFKHLPSNRLVKNIFRDDLDELLPA